MPLFHKVNESWFIAWLADKFDADYFYTMTERERDLYLRLVANQLLFICDEIELNAMRAVWKEVMSDIGDKFGLVGRATTK